ncbi:hypothetical protein ACFW04_004361 [Cataglyphis niger]
MSVSMQRLNRLRCTYSMLRFCVKGNYVQRMSGTLSQRELGKHSTRTTQIDHVACNFHQYRQFVILSTDRQQVDVGPQRVTDDYDESIKPEKMKENEYARNLFLNSICYSKSVMKPITTHAYVTNEEALRLLEQDWSLMTSEEILSAIKKLSYNICHNNNDRIDPLKYMKAFNALRIEEMSDNDLLIMMRHLVPFRIFLKHNLYNNFCKCVDGECVKRFLQLTPNEMLLLCDVIYQMMHNNISQYIWYAMRKLGNKPNKLTSKQLVQVLFFLNICRKPPINMYELEYYLERWMNELSINELAIATLGFFKTRTRIRNVIFLEQIMRKTIAEIDIIDSVSIGALFKLIRFSMQLTAIPTFQELLKAVMPHEPRFTLMSLTHIAHAFGKVALYDEEFIDRIIRRFNSEIKTARLKDFERFIWVLANLNFDPSNSIYQNVIEELRASWDTRRAREISKYPKEASRILGYLAVLSIYPTDLIGRVMAREHLDKICNGNYTRLTREYCVLDYSLRLEVSDYNGPFLKPSICQFLEKKYFEEFSRTGSAESSRGNLLCTGVLQTCQELFNTTSNISIVRPLPHYAPSDIVFCLDEQNQLVPSEEFLSQFQSSEIMRVDKETSKNVRWIALVMASHGLLIRNNNLPTGMLAAKLKQLSIIGYTPIMISYISWNKCASPQERCDYIKKLVFRNNTSELFNE